MEIRFEWNAEKATLSDRDMPKRKTKINSARSSHHGFELPKELNFDKLKFVGFGIEALERQAADRPKTVTLDSDVARWFSDSESVNKVLRGIIQSLSSTKRQRK